jgi:hypothetical protein
MSLATMLLDLGKIGTDFGFNCGEAEIIDFSFQFWHHLVCRAFRALPKDPWFT